MKHSSGSGLKRACIVAGLAGVLYVVLLFSHGCGNDTPPTSGLIKIRAGHLVALDMAPLFVAKEAGYFEEEGLDVETIFFANPGDNNAALTGGSIQFSTNPFTLPYLGQNAGVPMRIISSAGGLGIIQAVIQGKYGVKSLKDLATWVKANPGKKLKVGTLRGDTLEMILYKGFGDVGLSYDDFEMIWFNDLLAMVQAFQTKSVDVLSHIKPYTTNLIKNFDAEALTDNSEVWGYGTPNCTVAVLQGYLDEHPEIVGKYLRATYRAFDLMIKDPKKAVALLEGGNYYKVGTDVLLYALENQPKEVVLLPNVDGMNMAIDDMVKMKYIKKPEVDIVRTEILEAIIKDMKK